MALIDRAPSDDDLRSHRLEVLAARRLRALGRPVPPDFAAQERFAVIALMTAPIVLERVRAAYEGPAIVIKGPEVAARYPDPALRGYGDIDLLVPNADEVQRALLDAGFEPVGDPELYVGIHHLRPLLAKGMPLTVEIHSSPKWLGPVGPPSTVELFAAATAGTTGVAGMLTLPPEHHALVLAVHSWAHEPLRRLGDIIDIAAMIVGADRTAIGRLAQAWGVDRLWSTTLAVADSLLCDGVTPLALRLWAQNLHSARERTVLEHHLQLWLSDFWAMPFSAALARTPRIIIDEIRPESEEGWRAKLLRTSLAVRHAARGLSYHQQELDLRFSRPRAQDRPDTTNGD